MPSVCKASGQILIYINSYNFIGFSKDMLIYSRWQLVLFYVTESKCKLILVLKCIWKKVIGRKIWRKNIESRHIVTSKVVTMPSCCGSHLWKFKKIYNALNPKQRARKKTTDSILLLYRRDYDAKVRLWQDTVHSEFIAW